MKKKTYIAFDKLGEHQERYPNHIPVIGKIVELDGRMFGEIKGYCDHYANPVSPPIKLHKYQNEC